MFAPVFFDELDKIAADWLPRPRESRDDHALSNPAKRYRDREREFERYNKRKSREPRSRLKHNLIGGGAVGAAAGALLGAGHAMERRGRLGPATAVGAGLGAAAGAGLGALRRALINHDIDTAKSDARLGPRKRRQRLNQIIDDHATMMRTADEWDKERRHQELKHEIRRNR